MLETKFSAEPVSDLAPDGAIRGYAAIFNAPDASGDVILPGAFAASLGAGRRVKLLWQHDPTRPIGVWDEIVEDDRGLRVSGRLALDVQQGREAQALLALGALDGLSIGYRTVSADEAAGAGRRLSAVDLWEVSLVTFPMSEGARIAPPRQPPHRDEPNARIPVADPVADGLGHPAADPSSDLALQALRQARAALR